MRRAGKVKLILLSVGALAALVVLKESLYTVQEGEQVVLTQFGEPVGEPVTDAGLHFKAPFVQEVNRMEKRILEWDGDPNLIPTRDKTYIYVDVTARWRITDPLKFFKSVVTETAAQGRLDDILDGATRDAISGHDLIEAIRLSNRPLPKEKDVEARGDIAEQPKITMGRRKIQEWILKEASSKVKDFGITLVDVRIKRINYSPDVQRKVYDRMISERRRIAEKFRSEGQGKKAEIDGQREKELKRIQSEAYKQAQEIQGKADARAAAIYAEAYGKDPEFYKFLRSLEALQSSLARGTEFIGTTKSEIFKLFKVVGAGTKGSGKPK